MSDAPLILGLESSCDDTAAAVVAADRRILSNVVWGQTGLHADYGGVVPEIAARAHVEKLDHAIEAALTDAGATLCDLAAIAVTAGPGLIGGVIAGVMTARGLSETTGLPLYPVNHLAGHALTPRLTDGIGFPYLLLLVSGGHCQFVIVRGAENFLRLGGTIDDAPGEAFDKTARALGLPDPGGPSVEAAARAGDPARFDLPRPLLDREGCDLSFSGLKTALLRARDGVADGSGRLAEQDRADLCAAFQAAVAEVLAEKSRRAIVAFRRIEGRAPVFAVAGGVAANAAIRSALMRVAAEADAPFLAPPPALCTDNAAMIAWTAHEMIAAGIAPDASAPPRPRWPLDANAAPMLGSGRKGAKA